MNRVWPVIVLTAILFGALTGRLAQVGSALTEGAADAVTLCLGIAGTMCLWRGLMEVMQESGLSARLSRILRPVLSRLLGNADAEAMEAVSANVSANLLGLANAATPLGLEAARRLDDKSGRATDALCMLVVLNSSSLQLIPASTAALRASLGAAAPYDILPAVWLTSLCSLGVGITAACFLRRAERTHARRR